MLANKSCHLANFDGEEELFTVGSANCELLWIVQSDEQNLPIGTLLNCVNNESSRRKISMRHNRSTLKDELIQESALGRVLLQHAYGRADEAASTEERNVHCQCANVLLRDLPSGRPYFRLARSPLFNANISHDSGCVAIAGTARGFVGVDIMRVWTGPQKRPVKEHLKNSSLSLLTSELDWIGSQVDVLRAFLSVWVAKEAAAKATGWGFSKNTDPETLLVKPLTPPMSFQVTFLKLHDQDGKNPVVFVNEEEVTFGGLPYIVGTAVVPHSATFVMEDLRATVDTTPTRPPSRQIETAPPLGRAVSKPSSLQPLQIGASVGVLSVIR